jgi:hypothetical protein
MESLIRDRLLFELQVYDFLVDPVLLIPESFWEPVIVSLNEVQINELLPKIYRSGECGICTECVSDFKELKCCNQHICVDCTQIWFSRSVRCPYCNKDIRELIINEH